jgi:hypothetical protein
VAPHQQENTHFYTESRMRTMKWVPGILHIRSLFRQLRRFTLFTSFHLILFIIVPNVHAPTENDAHDLNDSFYKEFERVFDKFPK